MLPSGDFLEPRGTNNFSSKNIFRTKPCLAELVHARLDGGGCKNLACAGGEASDFDEGLAPKSACNPVSLQTSAFVCFGGFRLADPQTLRQRRRVLFYFLLLPTEDLLCLDLAAKADFSNSRRTAAAH